MFFYVHQSTFQFQIEMINEDDLKTEEAKAVSMHTLILFRTVITRKISFIFK